jgi:hypothetical protein
MLWKQPSLQARLSSLQFTREYHNVKVKYEKANFALMSYAVPVRDYFRV